MLLSTIVIVFITLDTTVHGAVDGAMDSVDIPVTTMAMDTMATTTMDVISTRGLLMLSPRPKLKLMQMLLTTLDHPLDIPNNTTDSTTSTETSETSMETTETSTETTKTTMETVTVMVTIDGNSFKLQSSL